MGKSMDEHSQKTEKQGRAGVVRAVLLLVVIPLLLAGVSYAWLYSGTDIQTLLKLQPPSNISILEPDQNKSLDLIRLDTSNGTTSKDGNTTTITFYQPFRVRSDCRFRLEIVHTTNLRGLSFKLYQTKKGTQSDGTANASEENTKAITVTYNGKTYTSGTELNVNPINPENPTETNGYKFADKSLHSKVYTTDDKNVQAHAEPLFWLVEGTQGKDITDSPPGEYYYILEASWTEDTSKETDLFYILAARAPEGEASGGSSQTGDATGNGE